jgi:hypothetical protein
MRGGLGLGLVAFLGEINPVAISRYQRTQDLENEIQTFWDSIYFHSLLATGLCFI